MERNGSEVGTVPFDHGQEAGAVGSRTERQRRTEHCKKREEAVVLLRTGGENIGQDPAGGMRETLAETHGISTTMQYMSYNRL